MTMLFTGLAIAIAGGVLSDAHHQRCARVATVVGLGMMLLSYFYY